MSEHTESSTRQTPLFDLHRELGGRLVSFAGWALPVRYDPGPVAEHLHTRAAASLFDVGHMAVVELHGPSLRACAEAFETVVPADVIGLGGGAQRYTFLTNDDGGIVDDLIVATTGDHLTLVANASRRMPVLEHLRERLGPLDVDVVERTDLSLLALQGPDAVRALAGLAPGVDALGFMEHDVLDVAGVSCRISRSGYTGEDGVEILVPGAEVERVARALLERPEVLPAGLAARDSLRLEAGLCLYGNDLDESTTPVEAGLSWSIPGRRRADGGFPGHEVIAGQLQRGPERLRVGLRTDGRRPVRADAELLDPNGEPIGRVTSGGYGPTFGGPVAMGYVTATAAAPETHLVARERGRDQAVVVTQLPFVTRRYQRRRSSDLFQERP